MFSAQAPAVASGDGVFLDMVEVQNAATTFTTMMRRGNIAPFSSSAGILTATSGTAPVVARRGGALVREWTSVFNVLGSISSAASPWPIGLNWASRPPALRFPSRWVFEASMVRVTFPYFLVPLTFGFQLNTVATGQPSWGITGTPYFMLASNPFRNNGNWAVISCAGGSTALTTDTGVAGTTPIAVRFVYEDNATPRMWVELNGVVYGAVSGMTQVPNFGDSSPAAARAQFYATQGGSGADAGQVDRIWNVRVWAQDLGGTY